jgi:hypothetical protein
LKTKTRLQQVLQAYVVDSLLYIFKVIQLIAQTPMYAKAQTTANAVTREIVHILPILALVARIADQCAK